VNLFRESAQLLLEAEGRKALRYQSSQVNAALTEALFVGLMRRLAETSGKVDRRKVDLRGLPAALNTLTADPDMTAAISRATANEDAVRTRLDLATRSFASV
jgi:hypothetical protein